MRMSDSRPASFPLNVQLMGPGKAGLCPLPSRPGGGEEGERGEGGGVSWVTLAPQLPGYQSCHCSGSVQ